MPGSFSLQLGWFEAHRALAVVLIGGGIFMLVLLVRVFWKKLQGLWEKAKQGGAILAHPRAYLVRVVLPSFGAWSAKLGVIAVFLAAYGIPVTFHTVMSVAGTRSPNIRDPRRRRHQPGDQHGVAERRHRPGHGRRVLDRPTADRDRVQHRLRRRLVVWAFGWTGGKVLVKGSYDEAKVKVAEQKAQRRERRARRRRTRTATA